MKKLPSISTNIVEEEGWKPWSYDDRFGEAVGHASWESFSTLSLDDIAEYLSELIKPTRGPMVRKRWSIITQEDLGAAAQAVKNGQLEEARLMFTDAGQWMYEEAGTPTDRDIKDAMDTARDNNYGGHLSGEWDDYAEARGIDRDLIAKKLVDSASYERKPGWYDRYIALSWERVPEAKDFVKFVVKAGFMNAGMAVDLLKDQLKAISDDFIYDTLQALQKDLDGMDWENRAEWRKHWEASKKEHGKAAIQEIFEFLEKEPLEEQVQ